VRTLILLIALLVAALASAQEFSARFPPGSITTREQADQAIEAAQKEEARLEKEFSAREAECYRGFFVNDCREKVRVDRELARRDVRRIEVEAGHAAG
jgi:hypothetical protein